MGGRERGPLRVHRTEDRRDCGTGGIVTKLRCVRWGKVRQTARIGSGCIRPKKEGVAFLFPSPNAEVILSWDSISPVYSVTRDLFYRRAINGLSL